MGDGGSEFEWDEAKRRSNLKKHGIDFKRAKAVFADPQCRIVLARQHLDERREIAIGALKGIVVAVVFTRRGEGIRIISARRARRLERKIYERGRN